MAIRVLTWNLFHGRDHPPDPGLLTWRSRLLRRSERSSDHLQVNRDLLDEFASILREAEWELALLQECPPRWALRLAAACGASGHKVLTARNSLARVRALAADLNPDLIASNEGGSNLILARRDGGRIVARRELVLRRGPRPERRTMAFTRVALAGTGIELCVANLHASAARALTRLAEDEVRLAAERAIAWSHGAPLILGGDLNLRPCETDVFAELAARHGLAAATAPTALDHLLARGLEVVAPPRAWSPERREVRERGRAIRLSDHAPVEAEFALPAASH